MWNPELQHVLQQHMLVHLDLQDLMGLAQVCKDAHRLVMTAPPEVWQQAGKRHKPWHPPIMPEVRCLQAAVRQYAISCRNLALGTHSTVATGQGGREDGDSRLYVSN